MIHMNREYKDAIKIAPLLSAIEIASSTLHLSAIKIAPPSRHGLYFGTLFFGAR